MARVLVTGATGYVGRELVRQLLERKEQVWALGRNKADLGVPFIEADLTDGKGLAKTLEDCSFDWIHHIASLPGDTGDPVQMTQSNVVGLQNILEVARAQPVKRFVLASSISAYEWYPATKFSPPDTMPVPEDHPCRPRDMYSSSKRIQEILAMTYYYQYKVPVTVLRLTAVVGPRGRGGGRGWREFAEQLAQGHRAAIPHFSAVELCHYVDIRDVARMHIAASENDGAIGEIFNCCGPGPTRGNEFANAVESVSPGIIAEYGFPWSMAQGGEIAFDMSKAKRLFGFEPQYTLADSIRSIKAWTDAGGLHEETLGGKESFGKGVEG
jgi:UDP-glucuronate 4-epimerase